MMRDWIVAILLLDALGIVFVIGARWWLHRRLRNRLSRFLLNHEQEEWHRRKRGPHSS